MAKTPITELPIKVFMGCEPSDGAVAFIHGLPVVFKGKSPLAARRAADEWRKEEVAKQENATAKAAKRAAERKAKRDGVKA